MSGTAMRKIQLPVTFAA